MLVKTFATMTCPVKCFQDCWFSGQTRYLLCVTDSWFNLLICSPLPYQTRGTVYSGAAPTRSVAASTYGRNAYVWAGYENRTMSIKSLTNPWGKRFHHCIYLLMHLTCPSARFLHLRFFFVLSMTFWKSSRSIKCSLMEETQRHWTVYNHYLKYAFCKNYSIEMIALML